MFIDEFFIGTKYFVKLVIQKLFNSRFVFVICIKQLNKSLFIVFSLKEHFILFNPIKRSFEFNMPCTTFGTIIFVSVISLLLIIEISSVVPSESDIENVFVSLTIYRSFPVSLGRIDFIITIKYCQARSE